MNPSPLPPLQEASDIFSISDQVLADRLQFIEEIGFGNWGSVWACRPKADPSSPSTDSPHAPKNTKIAVKLVHRSKTPTTAARVRSLWNEMKVVRSLKHEPHPSIIPFYSFIITPSYALITMAFHPRLVPVEVAEHHAKPWFRSLLSGIEFLHKRGIVHNDIKPANILLSVDNVPVLVDFGFAEKYEIASKDAFHSNLSYGTPEYLSPERARGLPHDTRKSDIWSLGITFFEILAGRTPFEHSEGEQFSTKEDLEKYWSRTMQGKWVGSWKMSASIERMLRRMISPNADLRYNASQAMADRYWSRVEDSLGASHRKSASASHLRAASMDDIENDSPLSGGRVSKDSLRHRAEKTRVLVAVDKENIGSPPSSVMREKSRSASTLSSSLSCHTRSQPQAVDQTTGSRGVPQTKKPGRIPSLLASLSPIKHSPPTTNTAQVHRSSSTVLRAKENVLSNSLSDNVTTRVTRKPLTPQKPTTPSSSAKKRVVRPKVAQDENSAASVEKKAGTRRSRVFGDTPKVNRSSVVETSKETKKGTVVSNRMRDWERERQRLREMEEMEERMHEAEEERQRQRQKEMEEEEAEMERQYAFELELEYLKAKEIEKQMEAERQKELEMEMEMEMERMKELELRKEKEEAERQKSKELLTRPRIAIRTGSTASSPPATLSHVSTPLSPLIEEPSIVYDPDAPSYNESGLSILRQSLKLSFDMTKRLCKSSTQALAFYKTSREITPEKNGSQHEESDLASWEGEEIIREANPSLPAVRQSTTDEQLDRMSLWIKNVEKVVEDARQNFQQSTNTTLPPLPVAPISRRSSDQRSSPSTQSGSSRGPRRILAANHIFTQEPEADPSDPASPKLNVPTDEKEVSIEYRRSWMNDIPSTTSPEEPNRGSNLTKLFDGPTTPPRHRRRATIGTRSPESLTKTRPSLDLSPSKRREKSRSQNDLQTVGLGRAITPVNRLEFEIEQLSKPAPVPRLASLVDPSLFIGDNGGPRSPRFGSFSGNLKVDELLASPEIIDPYPQRAPDKTSLRLGVDTPAKKHLEGVYDRFLMSTTGVKRVGRGYQSETAGPVSLMSRSKVSTKRSFLSSRKPLLPPVSSEDLRRAASFDDFGVQVASSASSKSGDSTGPTVGIIVRRALKAISVKRL
ncbi:hypothetical protein BDY19DRAFT_1092650 [Irpex rosettiformis]|uniref:Uncharacterized protein n=1 Tax=Irpex rosettiformis TaxID=378272 RepID=A0ACB8TYE4_9APHY|nr:hypothetical protein BDY19DRAFT_1092650 [Irpex rosettiformis]